MIVDLSASRVAKKTKKKQDVTVKPLTRRSIQYNLILFQIKKLSCLEADRLFQKNGQKQPVVAKTCTINVYFNSQERKLPLLDSLIVRKKKHLCLKSENGTVFKIGWYITENVSHCQPSINAKYVHVAVRQEM